MKIKRFFMLLLVWIWLGCIAVFAEEGDTSDDKSVVIDGIVINDLVRADNAVVADRAELFSDTERKSIAESCKELAEKYQLYFVVYTTDNMTGSGDTYLQNVYEKFSKDNGMMLFISMNPRKVYVFEYSFDNSAFRYSDDELHEIEEAVAGSSSSGTNFYRAMDTYYAQVKSQMPGGFVNSKGHFVKTGSLVIGFLVCLALGGLVIVIMYFGQRSSKVTNGNVYMKEGSSVEILERGDIYTHTTTQVIHHQSSSGGGGGGGGGGHSGGGASF